MADDGWKSTGLEVLRTADFEGSRLRRPGLYAVCFAATWCPPTQRFVPHFVARRGKLAAQLAMVDITDTDDPIWDTFRIEITPSMGVFQDGELKARFDGRPIIGLREKDLKSLSEVVAKLAASK